VKKLRLPVVKQLRLKGKAIRELKPYPSHFWEKGGDKISGSLLSQVRRNGGFCLRALQQ
jgi:hypothetical protein